MRHLQQLESEDLAGPAGDDVDDDVEGAGAGAPRLEEEQGRLQEGQEQQQASRRGD